MLLDCTELDSNQRTLGSDPTGAATKLLKRHFQIVFFIFFPPPVTNSRPVLVFCFILCCAIFLCSQSARCRRATLINFSENTFQTFCLKSFVPK